MHFSPNSSATDEKCIMSPFLFSLPRLPSEGRPRDVVGLSGAPMSALAHVPLLGTIVPVVGTVIKRSMTGKAGPVAFSLFGQAHGADYRLGGDCPRGRLVRTLLRGPRCLAVREGVCGGGGGAAVWEMIIY